MWDELHTDLLQNANVTNSNTENPSVETDIQLKISLESRII